MLTRETILLFSNIAGIAAVLCVCLSVHAQRGEQDTVAGSHPARSTRHPALFFHGLWFLALLKLAFLLQATMSGYVTQWPDDACRFLMTTDFVREMKLGPPDHIWPGGPFMLGGVAMRFSDDWVFAVRWLAIAFSAASVLATGWLTREVSGSAAGGLCSALIIAVLPMHTWLGNGAMTEVPFSFFLTASLACALTAVRLVASGSRWTGPLILVTGFLTTVACSYRYEGWMFLVGLAAVSWGVALYRRIRSLPALYPRIVGWLAVATMLALLFPVAWSLDSWRVNGSPLAFFKSQTAMNTVGVSEPLSDRLILFPIGMNNQIKALWGLILGGVVCSLILSRRRPHLSFFTGVVASYFAILAATVATKGMGVSLERYVMSLIVLAVPFAGIAVGVLEESWRSNGRGRLPVCVPGLAATALTLLLFTVISARDITNYKWWGYQNESFVAGALMQQEFHEPQLLPGLARGGRVMIWQWNDKGWGHHWHIPLMAGHADRTFLHEGQAFPEARRDEPDLTILLFNGGEPELPRGFRNVAEMGTLKVYHRFPE